MKMKATTATEQDTEKESSEVMNRSSLSIRKIS
jgi:hypothetical protein